jgi:hypothetical protein
MANKEKKDSDYSFQVLKVLKSERVDDKNRLDLVVVKWSKAKSPVVEKRRVWERGEAGDYVRQTGLNIDDIKLIRENYADIINLM